MATNQLLPFGMGESPNRIPFADWNTLPARLTGFQSGIASSQQFNYILAQGGLAGYLLGQMIVEFAQQDATLSNAEAMYTALKNAIAKFVPSAIADKSIVTAKIADLAIATAKLADGAVTTQKLADAAVTAAKILDGAVGTAELANAAVTNDKIAQGTITFDRLASAAIATKEEAEAGTSKVKVMTPWAVAQALAAQMPPAVPTGMILPFAGTSIPDGFLACNGSNVSRTTYANLFSVIGTRYGEGDGSTTFTLPNLHRKFAEYTTTTSEVGQSIQAGLPNISGDFNAQPNSIGDNFAAHASGAFLATNPYPGFINNGTFNTPNGGYDFDASSASSVYGKSSTVQPASMRLIPCIKI